MSDWRVWRAVVCRAMHWTPAEFDAQDAWDIREMWSILTGFDRGAAARHDHH